jgi:hypothetical protein
MAHGHSMEFRERKELGIPLGRSFGLCIASERASERFFRYIPLTAWHETLSTILFYVKSCLSFCCDISTCLLEEISSVQDEVFKAHVILCSNDHEIVLFSGFE